MSEVLTFVILFFAFSIFGSRTLRNIVGLIIRTIFHIVLFFVIVILIIYYHFEILIFLEKLTNNLSHIFSK